MGAVWSDAVPGYITQWCFIAPLFEVLQVYVTCDWQLQFYLSVDNHFFWTELWGSSHGLKGEYEEDDIEFVFEVLAFNKLG